MRGIRLSHGVSFIEHEGLTVKVLPNGECSIAKMMLEVLEWDLRCEPPSSWEYIYESEIKAMEGGVYDKVIALAQKYRF